MAIYRADEIIAINAVEQGRAGVPFLNWNISERPISQRAKTSEIEYAGAGLYGLYFDDELIYIGSYLGNDGIGANFEGDVVKARWWTHIGAITARGNKLHIARRSLRSLTKDLGDCHIMVTGFLSAIEKETLHKDAGNLGPLRRLRFAAKNHAVFFDVNLEPTEVLRRFKYVYIRISSFAPSMNSCSLKAHIENAEENLIRHFAPICNTTYVPKGAKPVALDLLDAENTFKAALEI